MATEWYYNAKTGEIDSYEVCGNLTDFPRGVFLAYGDYLVTGIKNKEEAEKRTRELSACLKCKSVYRGKDGEPCPICKAPLQNFKKKPQ